MVDIGCGTGLSTVAWSGYAGEVVGVEPGAAMLERARRRAEGKASVRFVQAFSDATGLPDGCADIVTCSQSFHWMDPAQTIPEIARILRPGGVFAAFDCDWPPVCDWRVERAYEQLFDAMHRMEKENPKASRFARWDKFEHLQNLKNSGLFAYAREVLFSQTAPGDAQRFLGLACSQGDLQILLEAGEPKAQELYDAFERTVRAALGERPVELRFCYRMRLAVK